MGFCSPEFWWSLLNGIIGNAIFTVLLIYGIQQLRYYWLLKRIFHKVRFHSYWKRFPTEIVHTIDCTVKGNVIKFSGCRIDSKDVFHGEVIVNPINLRIGDGFHVHSISDGFAFIKIIIEDKDNILVESHYTAAYKTKEQRTYGKIIPQGFIWKRATT